MRVSENTAFMPEFNAEQLALLATVSPELKKAFENDDEQAVQNALQGMEKPSKQDLWKKITEVKLWTPTKVWQKPIPKTGLAYTNLSGDDDFVEASKCFAPANALAAPDNALTPPPLTLPPPSSFLLRRLRRQYRRRPHHW